MAGTTLIARLSKDGTRVLCARPNCGCRLAEVVCGDGIKVMMLRGQSGHDPRRSAPLPLFRRGSDGGQRCYVIFGPGWLPDDEGLWTLTKRAK